MNKLLALGGNKFEQRGRTKPVVVVKFPSKSRLTIEVLKNLQRTLHEIERFWSGQNIIEGVLVSVRYNRIIAKSNRIQGFFSKSGDLKVNDTIVGAKFNSEKTKHIITHYISKNALKITVDNIQKVIDLFEFSVPGGILTDTEFNDSDYLQKLDYKRFGINKTVYKQYLRDACFIESFGVENDGGKYYGNSIVSLFDIGIRADILLKKIGIHVNPGNIMDDATVLLDELNLHKLLVEAPYLVSMAVTDFSNLQIEDVNESYNRIDTEIPSPTNEPIIGVIDTLFDSNVYFNEWVEYIEVVPREISKESLDYRHGTAVTSLIVDGPNLNPNLEDGCGRFKVKHFGVSLHKGFNSFFIVKAIRNIVMQNPEIKVWNLSLGAADEIKENFISTEAAILDEIQFEYDVIFVVAGTNAPNGLNNKTKIGAPADSLNSLIVSSVDFNDKPVSYSRTGIVLSFFIKPDVAYYGGGNGTYINVCEPEGLARVAGTSYAAPLVARKLAYLIHIMRLSREEAKALLIDSAIGWNDDKTFVERTLIGHGVVPVHINQILSVPEDEIKFIISDVSEKYDSYNYNFPVPINNSTFPYVAKAIMCYFPKCSRNQGVDYTNTELNLTFGVLNNSGISPINKDRQNDEDAPGYVKETASRNLFRKWDNVKYIAESFSKHKRPKKIGNHNNPQWGMSVKTLERLKPQDGAGIRFGIVVTLKELNGVNRIDEFINLAQLRGWLVNYLEVETQLNVYNKLSEEIVFE